MRLLFVLLLLPALAGAQPFRPPALTPAQDSIVARYATRGAERFSYLAPQWQELLNEGLRQDSTLAALWQMKAMPLFKLRKYETGMACLDRAVRYDSTWLPYRAFIKTIFSKQYRAALADLELCRARNGAGYVMDHSYDVYRALCHLQLEEFDQALPLLAAQDAADVAKNRVHHFRVFYLGIAYLELHQYEKALVAFDRALAAYPQFSDAYFYKGKCLGFLGRTEAGLAAMRAGKAFYEKGYTINEDNVVYETYPYQVTWRWKAVK